MFKVVFVDDETLVRLGLRSMINWKEEGFEIEGDASSGNEGLSLIEKTRPDLVITDIIMPEMDGIEMMQKVRENNLNPIFVFLSSYDQFELVKKAMQLGAKDYLLKLKLNSEMLHDMLGNVKKELEKDIARADKKKELSAWETEELKKAILKKALIGEMVHLEESGGEFWEKEKYIRIVYIVSNVHHFMETREEREKKLYLETIRKLIEDISREFFESYCIEWEKGSFLIFLIEDEEDQENNNLNYMSEAVIDMLMQYSNIQAAIGISGRVFGYGNLKSAYLQAKTIQDFLAVEGYGRIVFYDKALIAHSDLSSKGLQKSFSVKKLNDICETLNLEELKKVEEDFVNEIKENKVKLDSAIFWGIRFMCLLDEFLKSSWQDSYQGDDLDVYIKRLYYSDTITEITDVFAQYMESVKKFFIGEGDSEQKRLVREAKKYILDHVYDNIGLEELSHALFISSGYLSSIFSKYEPMGIANYINKVKIAEAQQLLKKQRLKVYEVAFRLGYENSGYFAKVFKKYTGCTPKEYMERK